MKTVVLFDIETLALARVAGRKWLEMCANRRSTTCFAREIVGIKAIDVLPSVPVVPPPLLKC